MEGLLQLLVDLCFERDLLLEWFADGYDVGPGGACLLAVQLTELAERWGVFGGREGLVGSEEGLADG